jgi:hypothetical protein
MLLPAFHSSPNIELRGGIGVLRIEPQLLVTNANDLIRRNVSPVLPSHAKYVTDTLLRV